MTDSAGPDLGSRRRAFVDGLFFRVVACSFLEVILAVTAIMSGLPLSTFVPGALVVAVACLANIPYWYVGKRRHFPLRDFFFHWAVDLVGITMLSIRWGASTLHSVPSSFR